MGFEDREWFRKDRAGRAKLAWNDRRGELELADTPKRRWRPRVPVWLRGSFQFLGYLSATLVLAWIVLYLVVPALTQ